MKKKILIVICMCMLLVACGKAKPQNQIKESEDAKANIVEESQMQENKDAKANIVEEKLNAETIEDKKNLTFQAVNYGDIIKTDFLEMTIETISHAKKLLPSDTSGVYSYMAENDGEEYFFLKGNMKNISGNTYSVEDIVAEITFDDKYNYNAFLAADNGGNDFYGDNVKPLSSVLYYIYASVPDEIVDTYSSCTIKFGFKENFSGSYFDDFEECDYLYKISATK